MNGFSKPIPLLKQSIAWWLLLMSAAFAGKTQAADSPFPSVSDFCHQLSSKLRTVDMDGCLALKLKRSKVISPDQNALTFREVLPSEGKAPKGRILFIAGIHGDEYAAISLSYLWLQTLTQKQQGNTYHWLFLPLANPDGLFHKPATRTNAKGVDLNRNFPSPDWDKQAIQSWKTHYRSSKRRYPGPKANSEIETQWMVEMIKRFHPDAIISLHAPYGLLDYDGPEHAQPNKIGQLKHRPLGTYPGSLGRYAGEYLNIPVLTLELKSAGRMPTQNEIEQMLMDLVTWVDDKIEQRELDF